MKKYLLCFIYLNTTPAFAQPAKLSGTITFEEDGTPAIHASVTIPRLRRMTTTDSLGNFTFDSVPSGAYNLDIRLMSNQAKLGFFMDGKDVDLGYLSIRRALPSEYTADVAGNETEASNAATLEEEGIATQNISGLLHASRDPYLNTAAFTFGAARFQLRGYRRDQQEVYINGIPMNDLESNVAYWGQWGGLNDMFRNQATTYGLAAADEGMGGLSGLTSIDATALHQRKQWRITYSSSNRSYRNRAMLTYGSGLLKSGWAFSLSASRRWAQEGYIPGTFYDGYSVFAAGSKKINTGHTINLVAFGAPTRRGKAMPSIQEAMDLAGTNYYNPNWGWQNGEKRNARIARSFQPAVLLSYDYHPSPQTQLIVAVSYQQGYNGNSALDWYNAQDPRPDYYRKLPSYYLYNPEGSDSATAQLVTDRLSSDPDRLQINWPGLYEANRSNIDSINGVKGSRSVYVIGEDRDDLRRYSLNASLRKLAGEHFTLFLGEVLQSQQTASYRNLLDLLGGDYYVNLNQFAERTYAGNLAFRQNDLNNPDGITREGDKYSYYYISRFLSTYAWGQVVASFPRFDFYVAGKAGLRLFSREGKFRNGLFADNSEGLSATNVFYTYSAKAGITFKANGRNYIFVNAFRGTAAPTFDNTYISPRTRNSIIEAPGTENIYSMEGGYLLRSPKLNGRLTLFTTDIKDATEIKRFYHEDYRTFVNYVMRSVATRRLGGEFALKVQLSPALSITAVASWMQAFYIGRPLISIYRDNDTSKAVATETSYMTNYYIAAGPQSAYSFSFNYSAPRYWYLTVTSSYFDRNYVDINPARLTTNAADLLQPGSAAWDRILAQEKLPASFSLDLFAGKSFLLSKTMKWLLFGTYLYINLGVNNVLNNKQMMTGGFEQLRYDYSSRNPERFPAKYFYAQGINYFLNISLKF